MIDYTTSTQCSASYGTRALVMGNDDSHGASIVKVEIYRHHTDVADAWATLETQARVSAYQTRAFLVPWLETIGAQHEIAPLFVLGKDQYGEPAALLCLGIERRGPFRIAVFLGGKDSNFNLGLFHPRVSASVGDLRFLFAESAKALGPDAPHFFMLRNQPLEWNGVANPLMLLPHQLSPSFAYATQLDTDADVFFSAKLSKDSRRKLRKKESRLAELGELSVITNDTPAQATAILDAFFAEKIARCEAHKLETSFRNAATRRFFEKLAMPQDGGRAFLEFYALRLGDKIISTYAGSAHDDHFSCIVNSFDTDPEIAKSSPGELLLMRLIATLCVKGYKGFDLGIGEARYKSSYCDVAVPLCDIVVGHGAIGGLYAAVARMRLRIKRRIKRNPKIFALIRHLQYSVPLFTGL